MRTLLVVLFFRFVVVSAETGPFGEIILGGGRGHFAVEADDFGAEVLEFGALAGGGVGEFGEKPPCLVVSDDVRM